MDNEETSREYLCTSEPFLYSQPLITGPMSFSTPYLTSQPWEEKLPHLWSGTRGLALGSGSCHWATGWGRPEGARAVLIPSPKEKNQAPGKG